MEFDYSFCPKCGGRLAVRFTEGRERQVCQECGFIFYRNPTPAVAVILQKENDVLLVKRKFEPRAGEWSLPAGFVEWGEGPEETAIREIKEETNLDIRLSGLYGVYPSHAYPDHEILLVVYRGIILGGNLKPGDDASEAVFFNLFELPGKIAFKVHQQILMEIRNEIAVNA